MKKLKTFRCHICETIIFTDKKKIRCENCGNSYVFHDREFYRENMWSKWRDQIRGRKKWIP